MISEVGSCRKLSTSVLQKAEQMFLSFLTDLLLLIEFEFDSIDNILKHLEDGLFTLISASSFHVDSIVDFHQLISDGFHDLIIKLMGIRFDRFRLSRRTPT